MIRDMCHSKIDIGHQSLVYLGIYKTLDRIIISRLESIHLEVAFNMFIIFADQ
jgi:hypothetical protein